MALLIVLAFYLVYLPNGLDIIFNSFFVLGMSFVNNMSLSLIYLFIYII